MIENKQFYIDIVILQNKLLIIASQRHDHDKNKKLLIADSSLFHKGKVYDNHNQSFSVKKLKVCP